jgi:hypothetical protein
MLRRSARRVITMFFVMPSLPSQPCEGMDQNEPGKT